MPDQLQPGRSICPACNGEGATIESTPHATGKIDCPTCQGTGVVPTGPLQPGPEADRRVAEALGWEVHHGDNVFGTYFVIPQPVKGCRIEGPDDGQPGDWNPSSDGWSACKDIVAELLRRGWHLSIEHGHDDDGTVFADVEVSRKRVNAFGHDNVATDADTYGLALCRAVLALAEAGLLTGEEAADGG